MIDRVQGVMVFVRDQDRAMNFYTRALGLRLKTDAQIAPGIRWIEVIPHGGGTSISLVSPYPGMPDEAIGGMTGIVLNSTNIQADMAFLIEGGARIIQEPVEQSWGGMTAEFADPDGNVFSIAETRG